MVQPQGKISLFGVGSLGPVAAKAEKGETTTKNGNLRKNLEIHKQKSNPNKPYWMRERTLGITLVRGLGLRTEGSPCVYTKSLPKA